MNQIILETMNDKIGIKTKNVPCGTISPRQLIVDTELNDATVVTTVAKNKEYGMVLDTREECSFGKTANLHWANTCKYCNAFQTCILLLFVLLCPLALAQLTGILPNVSRLPGIWTRRLSTMVLKRCRPIGYDRFQAQLPVCYFS